MAHGMELQIVDLKMALRTGRERLAFFVPVEVEPGQPHRVAQLLCLAVAQNEACRRYAATMLFADPALPTPARRLWLAARIKNQWIQTLMRLLPLLAPLGRTWQSHSFCCCAASEANAIGLPVSMDAKMLGHGSVTATL